MFQFETCKYCQTQIEWEGSDDQRGVIWGCDCCNFYFCEACFRERHGAEALHDMIVADEDAEIRYNALAAGMNDEILCPDCYGEKTRKEVR